MLCRPSKDVAGADSSGRATSEAQEYFKVGSLFPVDLPDRGLLHCRRDSLPTEPREAQDMAFPNHMLPWLQISNQVIQHLVHHSVNTQHGGGGGKHQIGSEPGLLA